jgi:2-dehydropantoate 2-reductase
MKIAVVGAGAVGGYFGGRLAQAGEEVVFIARPHSLAVLRAEGLRVESIKGDFTVRPPVASEPADIGTVDAVLVAVKAWQVRDAGEVIRPLIGKNTIVVPLQNGIDAPDILEKAIGPGPILGAFCRIFAAVVSPGHIRHSGSEPYVAFGERDGGPCPRGEPLLAAFKRAGVHAEISPDITAAIWDKFLFIASTSAVGAATGFDMGTMRTEPRSREMLSAILREAAEVGKKKGVRFAADPVSKVLAFVDSLPAHGTTSMQRDVAAGRPSELDYQVGAIVRLGRELGIPTPVSASIYESLTPKERAARGAAGL